MSKPTKPDPRPLFTPSTLPQPDAPDPVVAFIEEALLAIANRQNDEANPPSPPDELASAALEAQDREPTTT
jgi:hypothetical protein